MPDEARAMAMWLTEELTGKTRAEILLRQEPLEIRGLDGYLERLLEGEPIQYVFGRTEWMGLNLRVTGATLIPRPETSELVDWVTSDNGKRGSHLRVLDIGTGSGCIAIALKKRQPQWEVSAWDVSEEALETAKENARNNGVEIDFDRVDILSETGGRPEKEDSNGNQYRFDIVVSNPPYILSSERGTMDRNVTGYEPESALFVPDDDPLIFYRAIAQKRLAPAVYFEINESMGDKVKKLLTSEGYENVVVRKDSYGKDRMVRAELRIYDLWFMIYGL